MKRPPSLTPEQEAAVRAREGAYVLVAPPGSGKTEVLVRRILHIVAESRSQPFRILALTFTTKAAEGVRQRVRAEMSDAFQRVTAATFHSFCLDMLRHYGESVGVRPDVTVFEDDDDRAVVLLRGLQEEHYLLPDDIDEADVRGLLARIDRLRVDLTTPADSPAVRILGSDVTLAEAYEAYEAALAACGALDFNAMLVRSYQLLSSDPWVGQHYRRIYRYILVDEAQDTNLAQYEILRALCGDELKNVFVVADANQSVFAFTGASPVYVDRFADDFAATRLELTTNFRSASSIIRVAGALATHIKGTKVRPPAMVPATSAKGWVGGWSLEDSSSEADAVAGWIGHLLEDGLDPSWLHEGEDAAITPEDICVLGRTRYAFDPVVGALHARGIPYLVRTEEGGLFDSELGRAVFYGLRVLANPQDFPSRRRLLRLLIPEPDVAIDMDLDLSGLVDALAKLGSPLSVELSTSLRELMVSQASPKQTVEMLTTLDPHLAHDDGIGELWRADRELMLRCWREYEVQTPPQEQSLSGFLLSVGRLQRASIEEPGVRVLTPYRAKGLEFRVVVLLGMNEGTFPYYRALDSDRDVNEERRGVYVAVTRAARALLLTRPRYQTTRYGSARLQEESRFLKEMGVLMEQYG